MLVIQYLYNLQCNVGAMLSKAHTRQHKSVASWSGARQKFVMLQNCSIVLSGSPLKFPPHGAQPRGVCCTAGVTPPVQSAVRRLVEVQKLGGRKAAITAAKRLSWYGKLLRSDWLHGQCFFIGISVLCLGILAGNSVVLLVLDKLALGKLLVTLDAL